MGVGCVARTCPTAGAESFVTKPSRYNPPHEASPSAGCHRVGASTILAGGTDYIAVLGDVVLPATNGNSRQATDMVILLTTLTALTALAGTQLLRRA